MVKVTFIGQSCVMLEGEKTSLIIDPYITDNPDITNTTKAGDIDVDYILVTHGHFDHLGDAIDIAKRTEATLIAPFELATYCGYQGVKNIHPMHIGGAHRFSDDLWVKLTIAHHGSAVLDNESKTIIYTGNPCGFIIELDGKKFYHAGDTGLFLDMQLIGENNLDLAMIPIGDNFTMGPEDGAKAVELLKPKMVMPMHYIAWGLIRQDPEYFKSLVGDKAEVKIAKPGDSFEV